MNEEDKKMNDYIDLGDDFKLVYQNPEIFSKYYIIYHGQKYSDYYFRKSPDTLIDRVKYMDSGYLILKNEILIGGVLIKPNYISDLFIVPPYDDYQKIVDKTLEYLKNISNKSENILIQEVVESLVPFYKNSGCVVNQEGFWMIRTTEKVNAIIPDNYISRVILEEDISKIGNLIVESYKANPSFKIVYSKDDYVKGIEGFIKNYKENVVLYNSSRVVICKTTNEIVGVCYNMEFEGFPLVTQIAVRPSHQGKGIGRYLLKHSINVTSTIYPAIRLYVYKNNKALRLYESIGFTKNKTLNDMYLME